MTARITIPAFISRLSPRRAGLYALALLGLCWVAGFAAFAAHIARLPALPEHAARNDAIIVLTGGAGRIGHGLDLLARGQAPQMFITGVNEQVDIPAVIGLGRGDMAELVTCCVTLGHQARNTRQNAIEARKWITGTGNIADVTLVTSSYHMPRALLEFRQALPGVTLTPAPVTYGLAPAHDRRQFWLLAFTEYNKTLLTWLRVALTPRKALNTA